MILKEKRSQERKQFKMTKREIYFKTEVSKECFSPTFSSDFCVKFYYVTFVCALIKGNPTLQTRKSKSTRAQEIPLSSWKKRDGHGVREGDKVRQSGDEVGYMNEDR